MDVATDGLADGVQAAPVLDGSLRTQDQGSVSDSAAKHWDAGIRLRYRRSAEAVARGGGHGRSIGG